MLEYFNLLEYSASLFWLVKVNGPNLASLGWAAKSDEVYFG